MSKKTAKTAKQKNIVEMPLVNPYSAGIDVGDTEHVVAIPEGIDKERVKKFGTMTCHLEAIIAWLKACGIVTVAMESTGVYWKPLFSMLVCQGFEVYLVNSKHVKNVTGRKTDEDDAMWIQKLHSCGLLKSSYLPDDEQEALRTLVRHRKTLIQDMSRFINRMQKSLELMNIKFHTVISDITGKTGKAVIEAILAGERNAENFLPLIGSGIKADHETIQKSLQGNWRDEHLFTLKQNYDFYKMYQQQIAICDMQIEKQLQHYEASRNEGEIQTGQTNKKESSANPAKKKKKDKNHPKFNVRGYLERIHGVDVLAIYGLSDTGGLELLAETGTDLSKWQNELHFVSWLNLCPNNRKSGGKLISSKLMKKKPNTASQAFRNAANAVQKSDHWLGDYFRRMKAKGGNKYAVVATANKIATIYYKMVRYNQEFNPVDLEQYQQKYKKAKIAYLERKLNLLKQQVA
ncbi:MAG: IS110 family transposase [Bacteroidales bacterium]